MKKLLIAIEKAEKAKALREKARNYFERNGLGDGSQLDPSGEEWNHMLEVIGDVWKAEDEAIHAECAAREAQGVYRDPGWKLGQHQDWLIDGQQGGK